MKRWILVQAPMTRVLLACAPAAVGSVYFFGWRSAALLLTVGATALLCEGVFIWPKGKPATSAVLVTAMLLTLSLPPTIPFWMAAAGAAFAVVFGKMAFGGMAANVFNPAMAGRCFLYICFPVAMTARWALPAAAGAARGLAAWGVEAVTAATPLDAYKAGEAAPLRDLFLGAVGGSLGETSALLVLIGGVYLLVRRTAAWQTVAGCLAGCVAISALLHYAGASAAAPPAYQVLAGGFLLGAFFMATDPVSAARTVPGRWIYGVLIGALTVLFRAYSNFSCGLMFAILIGNMFAPLIDAGVRAYRAARATGAPVRKAA